MFGKSRLIKLVVFGLLLLLLGVGGVIGYGYFFGSADKQLDSARAAYQSGVEALDSGDFGAAGRRFKEAELKASKAFDFILAERKRAKSPSAEMTERFRRQDGEALWTRALAMRDGAFAAAAAEGKPIADTDDTTTREKFRGFHRIPDSQVRGEAIANLREAATRLSQSPEVLTESLRTELFLVPLQWDRIEPAARQLVELGRADARVYYLLARHEFEQPRAARSGVYSPTPAEKRSRERVLKSRDYLTRTKAADGYQLWRTLHLETQVARWLRNHATAAKKTAEAQKEDAVLHSLLLDERLGPVARASQGEGISAQMSQWDMEGLFETQLMALDVSLEDVREKRAEPAFMEALFDRVLQFCQKQAVDRKDNQAWLGQAAQTAIDGLSRVEPFVVDLSSTEWKQRLEGVQALALKSLELKVARLDVYERLAQMLARQAHIHARRGDRDQQALLNEQVMQWVDKGLKMASEDKAAASQVLGLHGLAAEVRLMSGGKLSEMTVHLDALRGQKDPRGAALANLIEGTAYERVGRLEKARQLLEKVLASPAADLALRAHMVLVNVYMAMNQPERALQSLKVVEPIHAQLQNVTPQEKAWSHEFLRSPEDLALVRVLANLETARQRIARHLREKPREQVPITLVKAYEESALRQLKDFPVPSSHNQSARRALIIYFALTARRDQALDALAALHRDYPDSMGALQLEVALLCMPEAGQPAVASLAIDPARVQKADEHIEAYMTRNPQNLRAKLLWSDWLTRTGRADQAIAYLEDPANFARGKDSTHQRLLAMAYMRKGDRETAAKLLQHLPADAAVDAALIGMAGSEEEQQKQLQQALARHEQNGLFRCWEGALHLQKGAFDEAASSYFQALEFTRVRQHAAGGLRHALFGMAHKNPRKARDLALRMFKDVPTEASLLLSAAYASLLLDEIGEPTDVWERTLTMGSALNHWEELVKNESARDPASVPLTKAEFWAQAARVDVAHQQILRALNRDPQNERALVAALNLALSAGNPELLPQAEKNLSVLHQVKKDDREVLALQGRLEEMLGRTGDALRTYETMLQKNAKDSGAYHRLVALLEQQDQAAANNWVKKWRTELPDDLFGIQAAVRRLALNGKLTEARQLAEHLSKEQIQKLADRLAAQKPPAGTEAAEWQKKQSSALDTATSELELYMAQAFLGAQVPDEAEAWLRRILNKRPEAESALLLLGEVHVRKQAWQPARDVYTQILARNKDNGVAANNLAWILVTKLDQPVEAYRVIQEFTKGRHSQKQMTGDRLRPEFLDTLGLVYQKLGKPEHHAEMRDLFEAARRRYPTDARIYLHLGSAYASLQDHRKAGEMLTTAIALAGPNAKGPLTPAERKEVLEAAQKAQKNLQ